MSDPVSNADIEDVLSSIRRLVSEEPHDQNARRAKASERDVDRFVLTPAFRVVEAERDDAPTAESALQQPVAYRAGDDATEYEVTEHEATELSASADHEGVAVPAPKRPDAFETGDDSSRTKVQAFGAVQGSEAEKQPAVADELTLEQRIAELEAALELSPQEWEPDGSEDGSSDETRPLSFDAANNAKDLAEAITHDTPQPDEASGDEDSSEDADEGDDIVAEVREALSEDAAGPGTADVQGTEEAEGETELDAPLPEDKPAEEWQDVEGEDGLGAESATTQARDSHEGAAEALRGWQDSPLPGGRKETAHEYADRVRAEAAEPSQDAEFSDGEEQYDNLMSEDETMIDEDALRELVSDLVREELQGVLGERITRNVRRLVRREIQRALTMRDLE